MQSQYFESFWPRTILPLNWRKPEAARLLRQKNTKEIIIDHRRTRIDRRLKRITNEDLEKFRSNVSRCAFREAASLKLPKNDNGTITWLWGKAVSNETNDAQVYELWIEVAMRGEQYSCKSFGCQPLDWWFFSLKHLAFILPVFARLCNIARTANSWENRMGVVSTEDRWQDDWTNVYESWNIFNRVHVEYHASNNVSATPAFILSVSLFERVLIVIVKHKLANLN